MLVVSVGRKSITIKIIPKEVKLQVHFGYFVVISSLCTFSVAWVDQFFVNHFLTLNEVGIYSLAAKLATMVNVVFIVPLSIAFSPIMMEFREHVNIQGFFTKAITAYTGIGVFILLAVVLYIDELFLIVDSSDKFGRSAIYVAILMLGLLISGLANFVSAGLFFARKMEKLAAVYLLLAAINLVLNILLIPRFGIVGAVFGSLVTYTLTPLLIYLRARNDFQIDFKYLELIKICLIGGGLISIRALFSIEGVVSSFALDTVFLFAYLPICFYMILEKSDRNLLLVQLSKWSGNRV